MSFKVPGGSTVAFVGATGSGKSTLTRLLFRFFDVSAGSILVDGQDLRAINQSSLRKVIGMVPQVCWLQTKQKRPESDSLGVARPHLQHAVATVMEVLHYD